MAGFELDQAILTVTVAALAAQLGADALAAGDEAGRLPGEEAIEIIALFFDGGGVALGSRWWRTTW